ncbi:PREDICTED: serine protease 38 [Chinchilla lanigera]|uniref:serine protease 38 n=1 Tax=Chinchilla lanigera TaxID=34839 RepID=UPI0006978E38|nr:PREDICTED: serine protease 38 [Chinchilla lanigera]
MRATAARRGSSRRRTDPSRALPCPGGRNLQARPRGACRPRAGALAGLRLCGRGRPAPALALLPLPLLLLLLPPAPALPAPRAGRPAVRAHPRTPACGRRAPEGRVLGGAPAAERRWPWQVSVHYAGVHVCGGAVLDAYWVLSAAHCFSGYANIAAFDVYVGLTNLRVAGAHTQWFAVHRVILHPTYEVGHPVGGDVALVQLQSPIEFSDAVRPVCLPPPTLQLDGSAVCWVAGWGLVSPEGPPSNQLQEAQLALVSQTLCRILYGPSAIQPDMLCAGKLETACEGDSGGPLVCEVNHTWVQIGIVSWGLGCAQQLYPAVFARVSHFSRWIRHHMERTPPPSQPNSAPAPARASFLSVLVTALAGLAV